jgi:hypothetical protein
VIRRLCEVGIVLVILTGAVLAIDGCVGSLPVPTAIVTPNPAPFIPASVVPKSSMEWLVLVGLLAVAASVALIGLAPGFQKIGLAGIMGGGALVAGALTVGKYQNVIPIVVAVGFVGLIAWSGIKRTQHVKELVATVDAAKAKLTSVAAAELFGDATGALEGQIKTLIQSPETTALVKKIRAKIAAEMPK